MKTSRAYTGNNSRGENTQVAESVSGMWFERTYCWNGFGMGFCKWLCTEKPEYVTSTENRYTGKITVNLENQDSIEYGFSRLYKMASANFRLPA